MIHNFQLRHEDYCCASESCPDDWCSQNCHMQDEQVRVDQDGDVSVFIRWDLHVDRLVVIRWHLHVDRFVFMIWQFVSCGELINLNK